MFGLFNSNKSRWKQFAESCDDLQFRNAVLEMFIPFNISINKYVINADCFENNSIYSNEYSRYSTPSMEDWALIPSYNLPLGIPTWFYPAFPDVATWIATPEAGKHVEAITEGKSSYELNEHNGKIRISILRQIVDAYIKATRNRLEVTD